MKRGAVTRVALIGFGAIGRRLAELLAAHRDRAEIVAVLVREGRDAGAPAVHSLEALLAARPDLVVECAGHGALREYAAPVLESGVDLVAASVGALADADFEARLTEAAARGGSRLVVPSGAIAALDALASARHAGLDRVRYTSRKPPAAWRGTKAEETVDLLSLEAASQFFAGSAREAALAYPQNANVAAAVALAGLGFDGTEARLIADPAARGNTHEVRAEGAFGVLELTLRAVPLPDNPKSSGLTPASLARVILGRGSGLVL